jgi:cyclopropane fatty-acyl-phospholipid synthase-like methyltransferase
VGPPDGAGTALPPYDAIADLWRRDRLATSFRERRFLERLIDGLPPGARVLDLGCGCGEPIGCFLVDTGLAVTGVDASERLLEHARRALPEANFLLGDMRTVAVEGPFDAIVAWDSVFHLPRDDHAALYRRVAGWLGPGGRLLLSLGGSGAPDFTSEMHGVPFFYSGHEPDEAVALLESAGFRVEHREIDDPTSRGHLAILAVREDR